MEAKKEYWNKKMRDGENRRRRKRRLSSESVRSNTDFSVLSPNRWGISSKWCAPLSEDELGLIDKAIKEVLGKTGMGEASKPVESILKNGGCTFDDDGRILFPHRLISEFLSKVQKGVKLCGRVEHFDMECSGKNSYLGSGGASPNILDLETRIYRETKLSDIYDAARLVEKMDNIHFFSRPMVARDMPDEQAIDINTAYACLKGTRKHVITSVANPEDVSKLAELCFIIAGSKEAFLERPFLSLNVNHSVSPLRYDSRSAEVLIEAAKIGIPVHANTFAQVGASTSAAIASSLAQTVAETFSGMILAWLVNPNARIIFGGRPMITDLRTGALSGGGGEQARAMSGSVQISQYYGLSNSSIAGATDSKIPDSQSGYEKGIGVLMSAMSGSNLITQAAGTHASLMGTVLESYIIDNDMVGVILRSIDQTLVTNETIDTVAIDCAARGEGHFLGDSETYNRMRSDYLYPQISNRDSIEQWEHEGKKSIWDVARNKAIEILNEETESCIPECADKKIRKCFDIYLD